MALGTASDRRNIVRTWFIVLGVVLLLLALLATFGVEHPFGGARPAPTDAVAPGTIHLEDGEMWLHYVLGIATLGVAYGVKDARALVGIAYAFGVVYVFVGLVGFFAPVIGMWHVGIGDNILHIAIGGANFAVGWTAQERAKVGLRTRA